MSVTLPGNASAWRVRMLNFLSKAGSVIAAALLLAAPVLASDGKAVGVDPDAVARLSGADRVLQVGADVSLGEQIVTGASGQVQIVFSDQTRLVVGPGSALTIESYLFNGNTADKFAINALAGSFRFISGNSDKAAYSIKTPTASIAVRGTKFDFNVSRSRTDLLLYEGAVTMCAGGNCQDVVDRCDVGVTEGRTARLVTHPDPNHKPLSMEFRYARFQTPLLGAFRINGAGKCMEPPTSLGNQPLGTNTGGPNVENDRTQTETDGGTNTNGGGDTTQTTPTTDVTTQTDPTTA